MSHHRPFNVVERGDGIVKVYVWRTSFNGQWRTITIIVITRMWGCIKQFETCWRTDIIMLLLLGLMMCSRSKDPSLQSALSLLWSIITVRPAAVSANLKSQWWLFKGTCDVHYNICHDEASSPAKTKIYMGKFPGQPKFDFPEGGKRWIWVKQRMWVTCSARRSLPTANLNTNTMISM